MSQKHDVIIAGISEASVIVAAELARAGLKVIVLKKTGERGMMKYSAKAWDSDDNIMSDWPISDKELKAGYNRVEKELARAAADGKLEEFLRFVAVETGNLELRPFAQVKLVHRDSLGRAKGVSYFNAQGEPEDLESEIVILAGDALENARLLLVSGINKNGDVGRRFYPYSAQSDCQASCKLDPVTKDAYGLPVLQIHYKWQDNHGREYQSTLVDQFVHGCGTHRMGWDRKETVVDPYGEVHECKGLFAIGAGQLPSFVPCHPMKTIMALAYMTADRLLYRVHR
ncbi:GMC oxidoreductase [Paenibacillus abyssi]|uniref:Glucose-methanol-choline oxidoreductase C-terminal domain-containing protein n=1 Tax=Paenibacillus abyssi TaxID=1340531 RepID=A0A917FTB4_9BACL|nr:GMC oxidoreductase [Paenibacillus abyssi]GGG01367.1 hypothetical protein GCM10010916_18110 [Paenibacillus abyssi]